MQFKSCHWLSNYGMYKQCFKLGSIWCENILGYLSEDIICSKKRTVFPDSGYNVAACRKTLSFEEQIISKDKYPRLFSHQMEAILRISF